ARRPGSCRSSRSANITRSPAFGASGRPSPRARRRSGGSGWPISSSTPDGTAGTSVQSGRERMRPRVKAGRLWGRGIEWDAIRALIADGLPRLADLRELLRKALDDDGALTDRASARLGSVRRELRERRRRLVADLERLLQAEGDRVFADRFVTVRHGRYVLPVRAEARGRLRGIVHDRSQSGQTLFVEPEAMVETNND